jgi:hypothetical protein
VNSLPVNFLNSNNVVSSSGSIEVSLPLSTLSSFEEVQENQYYSNPFNWKYLIVQFTGVGVKKLLTQRANSDFNRHFKTDDPAGTIFYLKRIIIKGRNTTKLVIPARLIKNHQNFTITVV